ncbi:hypothetical protein AWB78_08183 [Caballeronia calidae]|uniref:Uncharacterized protein n=1 Tax=Caballeronia calidae TaxID=1777139 RepID=A0A158EIC8_9BURK|nr:type II toxin-antitoxin system RelE/ParE family toxin [Caballeronia calidae]SAL06671.1 hypothetical protein AWB78_08183 [Caballeronia calidae]
MPRPKFQLQLTRKAEDDIEDALVHTLLTWGERQMEVYGDVIDQALATIQDNSEIVASLLRCPTDISTPGSTWSFIVCTKQRFMWCASCTIAWICLVASRKSRTKARRNVYPGANRTFSSVIAETDTVLNVP